MLFFLVSMVSDFHSICNHMMNIPTFLENCIAINCSRTQTHRIHSATLIKLGAAEKKAGD